MTIKLTKYFVAITLSLTAFAAVACSSDDDDSSTVNQAGSSTGGTAGRNSAAGAETADAGSGTNASGGSSSGGTSTKSGDVTFCQEECQTSDDCKLNGADAGFTCGTNHRCAKSGGGCQDDAECVAQLSGWTMACTKKADCAIGECVKSGTGGKCAAILPGADGKCLLGSKFTTKSVDGKDVDVCGKGTATCGAAGFCESPCASDDDCSALAAAGTPVCDKPSGKCVCNADSQCKDVANASVCHNGSCGCASDSDCKTGADKCFDGICGCSAASVCSSDGVFDGTKVVCAGI